MKMFAVLFLRTYAQTLQKFAIFTSLKSLRIHYVRTYIVYRKLGHGSSSSVTRVNCDIMVHYVSHQCSVFVCLDVGCSKQVSRCGRCPFC